MTGNTHTATQAGSQGQTDLHGLIREAIAGKKAAQKEIYDRYSPAVYGIIRRYIGQEAAAKEILNDSFFKILTKLESYQFKGAFEGWMRTIAIYTITDHVRRNKKHMEAIRNNTEDFDIGADQDITAHIGYKHLLKMVQELPDTQRMVFNLFVFEDYPHKDIAKLLEITENNCRWYLNDARKRLKEKIKSFM